MKQIVQNMKNGETEIVEVPIPKIKPDCVLIRTTASLVSAGTERMLVDFAEKSLVGKARSRPDLFKQVVQTAQRDGLLTTIESALNRLDQPIVLGYSSSGTVIEAGLGVTQFKPGDRVACAGGGFAVHAEYALIPENLAVILPDVVSDEEGAFATIGAIALNGVRLAQPQVGEKAAVIGLGLLGHLTAQILSAAGCAVVGVDLDPARMEFARKSGIKAENSSAIANNYLQMTNGLGFDHIFICADTKSNQPVELAGEIARDRASVIAIGAVGMEIPRKPYYEKELTFKVSRSYGPGRYDKSYEEEGQDYPVGYVRWTEGRNMAAVIEMIGDRRINVKQLITHRFDIEEAKNAYALLSAKKSEEYMGLIITYPMGQRETEPERTIQFAKQHAKTDNKVVNIGVIGAGNFANAVFLPIINKHPHSRSYGIASAKGLHAQQAAKKYGFSFASSDEQDILLNEAVDAAVILTQHDTHAPLVINALKNSKHVYCEKPLAIDREGLQAVIPLLENDNHAYLTVGFNRRFAPFIQEIKSEIAESKEPIYAHYRINAGFIPKDHWLHDRTIGGGRLVGEACHFIDLLLFLIGSTPSSVIVQALPNTGKYENDNFLITLNFADGSLGTIAYLANGSRSSGKEYLEIFTGGKTIIMDDFRSLDCYGTAGRKRMKSSRQDKGHSAAWDAFITAITNQTQPPIPYEDLILSSYTTLACDHAMQTGGKVNVVEFINQK
jgi:predicted dehydrogenase